MSTTKNMAKDPDFLNSLKAQGFEETQSKTKLVSFKTYLKLGATGFIKDLCCLLFPTQDLWWVHFNHSQGYRTEASPGYSWFLNFLTTVTPQAT